ncbi:hypothetical protein [Pseudanabaena yagii]|uniref:Uncharacterized protein n=1 Tax=Pseudanabaena yagii GIHE-NHR1 TaxID=2722753 RepID=A0ABX1LPI2_9CYAN|nr:hypothetical protein [Pseudanabaena yagii]NMF57703.1 hypothetical protein [Pseudanabaena yagii GIHE-NHR1]NMF58040.1 hypothetical protein [Pseudanabaena yagii GIHE-NHR1]NMF58418.1 hypothetical protein [Pseudanabaena yagii GIHE-NHR1]NMF60066.1 hypothetical protein [Pseudanabaena yagii GIHE-NHR1]
MPIQDLIAIATFAIAVLSVVYAFGERDARLAALEKDTNNLGKKLETEFDSVSDTLSAHDHRLDELSKFYVRVDERVAQLQRKVLGEEETERLRGLLTQPIQEKHYSTIDERWYSENSGIEM